MGFYYDPGSDHEPEEQGTFKEALTITLVVFQALALPLAIIVGAIAGLFMLVWLFTVNPFLGLAGIGLILAAVGARALWEWKHPPKIG